jgi:hypothetical protein
MKKLLSLLVMALLALAIVPLVMADGDDVPIDGGVIVNPPEETCYDPTITIDHTARGWYPNDQTIYTADVYGFMDSGGKYDCGSDYDKFVVADRQNYVFAGETVDYYVLARDLNGKEDIASVQLIVDEGSESIPVGACAPVDQADCNVIFSAAAFGVDSINNMTDQVYICKLIVPAKSGTWANGSEKEVRVQVTDGALDNGCAAVTSPTVEADLTFFNPTLSLEATGSVNFGTVNPGTIATSNSVYLKNKGGDNEDSGVIMDVYIASDDYFTDQTNPGEALCPTGNGIRYDQFSYYATKGSVNSGYNNNANPGLGTSEGCTARDDEFTELPSYSGNIGDMCRIINKLADSSLLTQGSEMSITFRLNVPDPCTGNFNNGQFHLAGRVV